MLHRRCVEKCGECDEEVVRSVSSLKFGLFQRLRQGHQIADNPSALVNMYCTRDAFLLLATKEAVRPHAISAERSYKVQLDSLAFLLQNITSICAG
ncbi:hypothetical protein GJ744_003236 [Endocarpon pusillum]|uniref:Uncharacterized protein n=1 Tax=Endocarpon pusillum TaxID=364733 RepID=A0A8H7E295_9EURO|nr:hypothetical protein GJ744_003236 [Endocarpon pusillum]